MQVRRLISSSYPNQHQGWFLAFGDGQPQRWEQCKKDTYSVLWVEVLEKLIWMCLRTSNDRVDYRARNGKVRGMFDHGWCISVLLWQWYSCLYTPKQSTSMEWQLSWFWLVRLGTIVLAKSGWCPLKSSLSIAGDKEKSWPESKVPRLSWFPLTWFRRSSAARNMTRRKTGCVSLVNKTLERCFLCQNPLFFWHISAWIWNLLFSAQISFQGLVKQGGVQGTMNQKYPQNFKCYHRSVFKSENVYWLGIISLFSPFQAHFCWNCFCRNSDYLSDFLFSFPSS